MASAEDYEEWERSRKAQTVNATGLVISSALDTNPDQYAKDIKLGRSFGADASMTAQFRGMFQKRDVETKTRLTLNNSPLIASWLQNEENAKLAHDDIDSLSGLEWFGRYLKESGKSAYYGVKSGLQATEGSSLATVADDRNRNFSEILTDSGKVSYHDPRTGELRASPDYWTSAKRWISSSDSFKYRNPKTGKLYGTGAFSEEELREKARQSYMSAGEALKAKSGTEVPERVRNLMGKYENASIGEFALALAQDPIGTAQLLGQVAIESSPGLAAGLVTAAATRNVGASSAAAGAFGMGLSSYVMESGNALVSYYGEKGIDITTQAGVESVLNSPQMRKEAEEKGFTRGLVVALFDAASGGLAGKTLSKTHLRNFLVQGGVQAGLGATGELAGQIATGEELNWNAALLEALAEMTTSPIEVAGLASQRFNKAKIASEGGSETQATLEQLSQQSQGSKLKMRMPEKFKEAIEAAGIDQNIFVPAQQFVEYFQGLGIDLDDFFLEVPGMNIDEIQTAYETGGDVSVPVSTYMSYLAGTDHDTFFQSNSRFNPEDMTAIEAFEFNERASEALDEAYSDVLAEKEREYEMRSDEQVLHDTLFSRLREAGRAFDVARHEALPWVAFYRTMAERTGNTINDLLRKLPLPEIRSSLPQGLQFKNIDALSRTLAELRSRKTRTERQIRGESLVGFLSNLGIKGDRGEIRGILDGRSSTRVFQKKLLRNDGLGIDDAARAAIEAGYLSDRSIVQEYKTAIEEGREVPDITAPLLEAIEEEIRGRPQFRENQEAELEQKHQNDLDEMTAYLEQNGISLDQSDIDIRTALEQSAKGRGYEQPVRGSVLFPANGLSEGTTVISLMESADLSTFLHESGHYFLKAFESLSQNDAALFNDWKIIQTWWRENSVDVARDGKSVSGTDINAVDVVTYLENGSTGVEAKDIAIDTGMQEQWARGFETYVMQGKAPSIELRTAFERFRSWLLEVYKKARGLGVTVSPEISGVFDRMLATDIEITEAHKNYSSPSFSKNIASIMGLTEKEHASFEKLREQAEDEASAKLLKETMAPIQREQEAWYKKEKAEVQQEVKNRVNAMPVYRAYEALANSRYLDETGTTAVDDIRISKKILIDIYGEGVLKTLPRGKRAVYSDQGAHPDIIAEIFGFRSGDELVRSLEKAPERKEAILQETEAVMYERHGDALNDGTVQEKALAAIHGDKKAQLLAAELDKLKQAAKDFSPRITWQQAQQGARGTISDMKVQEAIRPERFLAAERRSALEVVRLTVKAVKSVSKATVTENTNSAGKSENAIVQLVDAKRRQLLNHALYNEALKVVKEVEQAEKLVEKLSKKTVREKLSGDYLGAIDQLLLQYDFRKLTRSQEAQRDALNAYVQRMTEDGRANELAIPETVLNEAQMIPYKTLSVERLRGVIDTLRNIEHTARFKKKLVDAKKQRDLDQVVDGILGSFKDNVKSVKIGRAASDRGSVKTDIRKFGNLVLNAGTLLREIDGFKYSGEAYENIKAPIDAAMSQLTIERRKAAEALENLYSVYSRKERQIMAEKKHIEEIGESFSKWDIISVALNTGNADNYQRLTDRRVKGSFTSEQVDAMISHLEKRDLDFVQSMWDYVNSFWSQIEAREKRITGVAPKKVEARPVQTPHGTYKGGYYPIKYDGELSSRAHDDASNDIALSMMSGRMGKAQTKNGHLKERAQSSGRAVMIDIGVVHGHISQVIHDLALSETVNNSWKILHDSRVRDAFYGSGKKEDFDALEIWLQDVAAGQQHSADIMQKMARFAKNGFTVSRLALNLSTVLLQVTGISQSMVVVGKKNFSLGVIDMFRGGISGVTNVAQDVMAVSPFMRERENTFNKDIQDVKGDMKPGPVQGKWSHFTQDYMAPLSFYLMQKTQFYTVDLPTWLAGYRQALSMGLDEASAIAHADQIVGDSQASGLYSDRTAIERGSLSKTTRQNDVVRLFTTLGSYMFAKANVAYRRTKTTDFASPTQVVSWAFDMALLFTVEAVFMAIIKGKLPDEDDEEEGWAEFLAKETGLSAMGTLPFIRDMAAGFEGYGTGGAYEGVGSILIRPFTATATALSEDGEFDRKTLKSYIDTGGFLLSLPSVQINRFVEAWGRSNEGEEVPLLDYLVGKTGKK